MLSETVGEFHSTRMVRERREDLLHWRVTGPDEVVTAVACLLGGEPGRGEMGVELVTRSASVHVVVESWDDTSVCFRLADAHLGLFLCRFDPWSLDEVTGGAWHAAAASGGPVSCELLIRSIRFVTRNGTVVRYLRAVLTGLGDPSAVSVPADAVS